MNSPEGYLLALWVHECRRVFADKLINQEDKAWVDKSISDLCKQEFPTELCKQVSASKEEVDCENYGQYSQGRTENGHAGDMQNHDAHMHSYG